MISKNRRDIELLKGRIADLQEDLADLHGLYKSLDEEFAALKEESGRKTKALEQLLKVLEEQRERELAEYEKKKSQPSLEQIFDEWLNGEGDKA